LHCVMLASGKGSRSGRGLGRVPKPMLEVGGRLLIERALDFLFDGGVESVTVCTSTGDYPVFMDWLRGCDYTGKVELSASNHDHSAGTGPLHDLLAICMKNHFSSGTLVTAGNRLFDLPLAEYGEFCARHEGDSVCVLEDPAGCGEGPCGMAAMTTDDRVIDFTTDRRRRSGLRALPLVYLSAETLHYLRSYLAEGGSGECIGHFLQWSYRFRPLYAFVTEGRHFFIKDTPSLKKAVSHFEKSGGI